MKPLKGNSHPTVPDNLITLEILMPYREYMTVDQLARYGDYLLNIKSEDPFTWAEIQELDKKRQYLLSRDN